MIVGLVHTSTVVSLPYLDEFVAVEPLISVQWLIFLFKWYQFKSPQKYNNPETTVEELVKLLEKQEEIYSTHFGYPFPPMIEELFSGYGYMNLEMKLLELNIILCLTYCEFYQHWLTLSIYSKIQLPILVPLLLKNQLPVKSVSVVF